jgi:hypothetical protein
MFHLLSFWFAYFAVILLVDDVGLEMAYDANNTMRWLLFCVSVIVSFMTANKPLADIHSVQHQAIA